MALDRTSCAREADRQHAHAPASPWPRPARWLEVRAPPLDNFCFRPRRLDANRRARGPRSASVAADADAAAAADSSISTITSPGRERRPPASQAHLDHPMPLTPGANLSPTPAVSFCIRERLRGERRRLESRIRIIPTLQKVPRGWRRGCVVRISGGLRLFTAADQRGDASIASS